MQSLHTLAAARSAASNAASHTAAAAMRQAQALLQQVPAGATDLWLQLFAGRMTAAGASVTPAKVAAATGLQRPVRELGIRNLWLNWFHGGKTWNTVAQTHYYAALVWGTQYIGPMRLPQAPQPTA